MTDPTPESQHAGAPSPASAPPTLVLPKLDVHDLDGIAARVKLREQNMGTPIAAAAAIDLADIVPELLTWIDHACTQSGERDQDAKDHDADLRNAAGAGTAETTIGAIERLYQRASRCVLGSVYHEVHGERADQDEKWGGPEHDDDHAEAHWLDYIHGKLMAIPERFRSRGDLRGIFPDPSLPARTTPAMISASRASYRRRLKQIAGLAIAAIESLDRKHPPGQEPNP